MMIVSMIPAFGDANPDTVITIEGLQAGDVVHLYQVAKWVGTLEDHTDVSGWKATADFTSISTSAELAKLIDEGETGYTGITSTVAGTLAREAQTEIDLGAAATVGSDGKFTYTIPTSTDNENLGLYMALITPVDDNTVYNPVFVSADWNLPENSTNNWIVTSESSYYGVNAAAKKSTPELEKESHNSQDNTHDGETTKPGDIITFTVTTEIPGFGEVYETPQFVMSDTMDSLTYKKDISIALEDGTSLAGKFVVDTSTDTGYTLHFDPQYLKTLKVPTKIIATYTAEVKDFGENNYRSVEKEQNTVQVGYSHDPSWKPTPGEPTEPLKYKKDITNHYTFSIDAKNLGYSEDLIGESATEIVKVAVDRKGNPIFESKQTVSKVTSSKSQKSPLAGAEFDLVCPDGTTKHMTSDADGRILFEGLDEGTYTLRETKAPDGYVRDTSDHTIVISAVLKEQTYTEYYDQEGNWYDADGEGRTEYTYKADELESYTITFDGQNVATHTFEHAPKGSSQIKWSSTGNTEAPSSIHNTQGVELPSTGGIGTTIFYVGGSLMVLAAAILLITKRRMGVED